MKSFSRQRSGGTGFHLLELAAGLALFGTLVLTSTMVIEELCRSVVLKAHARQIAQRIEELLLSANQREADLQIEFERTGFSVWGQSESQRAQIDRLELRRGLEFDQSNLHATSIMLYAGGTASPGRILLRHWSGVCEIVISLRGRVRWSCADSGPQKS